MEVYGFLVFMAHDSGSRYWLNWSPTRESDNGALYRAYKGFVPTIYRSRSAARAAIDRSNRFSREKGFGWEACYKYRIQKVAGEATPREGRE